MIPSPPEARLEELLDELCQLSLETPLSHVDQLEADGVLDRYGESAQYKELRDGIRALLVELRELQEALAAHHHNRDFALQQVDCSICRPLLAASSEEPG